MKRSPRPSIEARRAATASALRPTTKLSSDGLSGWTRSSVSWWGRVIRERIRAGRAEIGGQAANYNADPTFAARNRAVYRLHSRPTDDEPSRLQAVRRRLFPHRSAEDPGAAGCGRDRRQPRAPRAA